MIKNIDYTLCLCTDRGLMSTDTLEEAVELSILGGCTMVQLREKNCSSLEFYQLALNIKHITDKYNIPLIINDRVDIAVAVDADGVHVGQRDLPATTVRKIIGKDKLIGVSASTYEEAVKASCDGADYIGVGAMYSTDTKSDATIVSLDELKRIRENVTLPILVIGGINKNTLHNFIGYGIDGLAVVSAVISQKDIKLSTQEIVHKFKLGGKAL